MEDGLGNNSVQCILQDKNGIMWIGTNSGLNRYDGAAFIQYSVLSRPALTSSVITALMQDSAGYIWIGTENGLNRLDPASDSIRTFVHNDNDAASLPPGPIRGIQARKDGSIWVLSETWFAKYTFSGGFSKICLDPSLLSVTKVFTGLVEGGKGRWWISYLDQPTAQARMISLPGGRDSLAASGPSWPRYSKVYMDGARNTWGISYYGVTRHNELTGQFEPWLTNSYARHIPDLHLYTCYEADADGNIWQGSRNLSLVKYNLSQRQVTDYNWLLTAGNASMVYCIYKDNNNTLWIGTDNGILKLPNLNSFFKGISCVINGKEQKDIRCRRIAEDKNGVLYAGTESHGLLRLTKSPDGSYSTRQLSAYGASPVSSLPVKDNRISVPLNGRFDIGFTYDMWYDREATLWLAGYGLGRYDMQTSSLEIFLADGDEQSRRESISQFSICPDGNLFWLGGLHNVFLFDTLTRRMHAFHDNKGNMPFHDIPCWCLVRKGQWIWAGTDKGLYKIDRFTRIVIKENTYPAMEFGINDIHIDTDGCLWISTAGGGILHYNTETRQLQQYSTRDGLSNNTICGILPDAKNNLWISTYAGLSYLDKATGQFTVFYAKDGLNMNEFNRKAFTRVRSGELIFGGLNGYLAFDPGKIFTSSRPVNLLLTRFSKTSANGAVTENIFPGVSQLSEVVIGPDDPFFSFTYTLTDMYAPGGNRYSYMLEGLDKDWHYIGNQHVLSFNLLPAGKYTLRIKGSTPKGAAAANQIAIPITVKQVFYKGAWFLILVLLVAAAIVFFIMKYRFSQWQKLQNLRTRIASDLHDEVGSNLVRIILLADKEKKGAATGSIREQLGVIADISRGAISTIKDVIWSIDARNDSMGGILDHMHDHVHNMLVPADIGFKFLHTGLRENEKLKMDFRQNVYLIFKEAINNIVKHAGASHVQLEIKREKGLFTMIIKDNGHGMTGKGRPSSQGLSNMKMRAARVKGELDVVSDDGGVTILLAVPV